METFAILSLGFAIYCMVVASNSQRKGNMTGAEAEALGVIVVSWAFILALWPF